MSEREYFSLRYAIPGYTFILLLIAINYIPLIEVLKRTGVESAFGAFLAFLSLFTGSAIGFLVSQFWYWRFGSQPLLGTEQLKPAAVEIYKRYLKKHKEEEEKDISQEIKDKIEAIGWVFEYIIRRDKEEKFFEYATRRWDMYHVFSSTRYALIIGAVVGLFCRFYCEIVLFGCSFSIVQGMAEVVALGFRFLGLAFLFVVLSQQRKRLLSDYCPFLRAIILKSKVEKEEVKEVFPHYFKEDK